MTPYGDTEYPLEFKGVLEGELTTSRGTRKTSGKRIAFDTLFGKTVKKDPSNKS